LTPNLPPIEWRVHLKSSPEQAFAAWTTDEGRAGFWAEESKESERGFELRFINGQTLDVEVVEASPSSCFAFNYFGGSTVTIDFVANEVGGCDLHLREEGVPVAEHLENYAGWVSVLLACKAAVDLGADLRSHDPRRSWDQRYVDN